MDFSTMLPSVLVLVSTLAGAALAGGFDLAKIRQQGKNDRAVAEAEARAEQSRQAEAARRSNGAVARDVLAEINERIDFDNDWSSVPAGETSWRNYSEPKARRAVELIEDGNIRKEARTVLLALSHFVRYAEETRREIHPSTQGRMLVRLLVELAGCAARGDRIDEDLHRKLVDVGWDALAIDDI